MVVLQPVDPSEIGMTAKYQNTQEAVKNHSYVKEMDLVAQAAIQAQNFAKSSAMISRPDIEAASRVENVTSYWLHNGSVMGLQKDGNRRTLVYLRPKDGLENAGIKVGTQLFVGSSLNGTAYDGVSWTFLKRCGAKPFRVAGTVASNNHSISLIGVVPKFDPNCNQIGQAQEKLNFTFLGTEAGISVLDLLSKQFPMAAAASPAGGGAD